MRVGIATDQGGFALKEELVAHLRARPSGTNQGPARGRNCIPSDVDPNKQRLVTLQMMKCRPAT